MPSFHLSISAALSLNIIFSNSSSPLCAAFPSAGGAAKLQPSSLSIASYGPPVAVAVLRYARQQPCRRAPILLVAKMLFTRSMYVCMYVSAWAYALCTCASVSTCEGSQPSYLLPRVDV
eukprot:GHVU01023733.1.p2 GENE.GHVU01023733.1~~GHVU01023733.1.p2  ORF type:complete len:119 (-),score=4.60 GHVU01023733.1:138-494(-)